MYQLKRAVYKISLETRTRFMRLVWKLFYGRRFLMGKHWKIRNDVTIELSGKGRLSIQDGFITRSHVFILVEKGKLLIGKHVFVNHNVSITCMEKIQIGDDCKLGNQVVITDHDHDYGHDLERFSSAPVQIGSRVWIGANVVITKGVTIGTGSVIGAGSVVTSDIPPYSVAVGAPARVIKQFYRQ